MPAIDDIISQARLPEQAVTLTLRGDLAAEHAALDEQLRGIRDWEPTALAAVDPRKAIAEQLLDLEAQMAESEASFTFRALGRRKYRELLEQHPGDAGQRFNPSSFPRALISACCIEPELTPTDVDRLFDVINEGSVETLFMAAYTVNEGVTKVPFSAAASDVIKSSGTTS